MAKVTLTKKLVEGNSQLAELLAERNIEVGSKIEQSELDDLYKVLETTELKELTQEHFDAEPGLADKGFEVGQVVRVKKKVEEQNKNLNHGLKLFYKVISRFRDKDNDRKIYEVGELVPENFEEERITDLLSRKLISEA
ncbi:hypothetical protein F0358_10740 [Empedobacter brevis]|uniref:hypothetical protein n=1 Tax=Empedobacter brevis TaxID=247 RepID=UPI00123DE908|nr:hypothetical protein [Empedobacter brevis]QES93149.1 hypothetical protein F0358_10740 [Empedobacter brevis]